MDAATNQNLEPTKRDLVLLVHGTYSASTSDTGDGWWQCGSPTWKKLTEKLPADVHLAAEGGVFHWSGENSERARSKAGSELLTRIRELESRGRSYHLVGHSHGGSVIWHALRQATLQRQQLSSLRSWSTIGTPFLQHRTRGAWHVANIVNLVLAIVLLRPAFYTMRKLVKLFSSAFFGLDDGILITGERAPALTEIMRGPILRLIESLGVPVTTTAEGIRVGSYDPTGGGSFIEYLFLTSEGWLILGVTLLCVYIYLNLATLFLSPLLESLRIRQESRLERKIMSRYKGRWLGLWSVDDEAINGLRTTLRLSVSFVHRITVRESVFFSDRLLWIARPFHWTLIPVYNILIRPMLDGVVRSHIVKTAMGNNRPAAEVVAVSPTPGPTDTKAEIPALPDWLCKKITDAADEHAYGIAPELRRLLAEPSFSSGLETFSSTLTGDELVHTSYFSHPEILDLLAAHIAWARRDQIMLSSGNTAEQSLESWFRHVKAQLGERVATGTCRVPLVMPRRAA